MRMIIKDFIMYMDKNNRRDYVPASGPIMKWLYIEMTEIIYNLHIHLQQTVTIIIE